MRSTPRRRSSSMKRFMAMGGYTGRSGLPISRSRNAPAYFGVAIILTTEPPLLSVRYSSPAASSPNELIR